MGRTKKNKKNLNQSETHFKGAFLNLILSNALYMYLKIKTL